MAHKAVDAMSDSKTALATSRFIHRKILVRLFLGWLLLSVMIGGTVLCGEINCIHVLG